MFKDILKCFRLGVALGVAGAHHPVSFLLGVVFFRAVGLWQGDSAWVWEGNHRDFLILSVLLPPFSDRTPVTDPWALCVDWNSSLCPWAKPPESMRKCACFGSLSCPCSDNDLMGDNSHWSVTLLNPTLWFLATGLHSKIHFVSICYLNMSLFLYTPMTLVLNSSFQFSAFKPIYSCFFSCYQLHFNIDTCLYTLLFQTF